MGNMVTFHALDPQFYRGAHRNMGKGVAIGSSASTRYRFKKDSSLSNVHMRGKDKPSPLNQSLLMLLS